MKETTENQLSSGDIHLIALRSKICLETKLIYYVMKISNKWSYGEIYFLKQYIDFDDFAAETFLCIKHEALRPGDLDNHTTRLTFKDMVLKFTKKIPGGKIVMKALDEFDTKLYEHRGSKSGRREMKKDLEQIRKKFIELRVLES